MRVLVLGDSYMPPRYFQEAFAELESDHEIEYVQVDDVAPQPRTESERKLKEFQGSPAELCKQMRDVEVLVAHGAPVTAEMLSAAPRLKLVCCARGGPVNVDVDAVSARGLPLVNTPGKNAEAVADQTVAFLVMLARGFPTAQRFVVEGNQVKNNWEGSRFMGNDLRGHTLGLVGYGKVGQRVAVRARAFGMTVLVYDPYVDADALDGIRSAATLDELLKSADFVSLHARASADNVNMFDARAFRRMKPGSWLVNTARETLVDEDALDEALESGRLAGAALDVFLPAPAGSLHRLLRHANVVMTPHIGGATYETLRHGAEMLAGEIRRFAAGEPLVNVVNRSAVEV